MQARTPDSLTTASASNTDPLVTHVTGWLGAVRGKTRTVAALAAAESRLAAISVTTMAFLATIAAVAVVVAWGLAVAGTTYALVELGMSLPLTLVALATAHVAIALTAWACAMRMARNTEFRATRDMLAGIERSA